MCKLNVHHTPVSDHDPIQNDLLSVSFARKQFRFMFENTWLKEPGFFSDVAEFWTDLPSTHLLPKLISVSSYMARWDQTFFISLGTRS